MARVIDSRIESRTVSEYFPLVPTIVVGMILGLLFWGLNSVFGRFTTSPTMAGDIATILVASVGLIVMVTMRIGRPIIIALSSAVTLWGLASWTVGLSLAETIVWEVALYALAYVVFSWISRYSRVVPVLTTIIAIVVIARIVTIL
jgi:hypothetical protein